MEIIMRNGKQYVKAYMFVKYTDNQSNIYRNTDKNSEDCGNMFFSTRRFPYSLGQELFVCLNTTVNIPEQGKTYITKCNSESLNLKPFVYLCKSPEGIDLESISIGEDIITTTKHIFNDANEVVAASNEFAGLPIIPISIQLEFCKSFKSYNFETVYVEYSDGVVIDKETQEIKMITEFTYMLNQFSK